MLKLFVGLLVFRNLCFHGAKWIIFHEHASFVTVLRGKSITTYELLVFKFQVSGFQSMAHLQSLLVVKY